MKNMKKNDDLMKAIKETRETRKIHNDKAEMLDHCAYCLNAGYGCPTGGCGCESCPAYNPDWEQDVEYERWLVEEADCILRRLTTRAAVRFPVYRKRVIEQATSFNEMAAR